MHQNRIKPAILTLVGLVVIGCLGALGWFRMMPPIRAEIASDLKKPLYALIVSNSHSDSFVIPIGRDGLFEDKDGQIKRGDVWALCLTDGTSIYWDGRIELGQLGQVTVPVQTNSGHVLSQDIKEILRSSIVWKRRNAEQVTP